MNSLADLEFQWQRRDEGRTGCVTCRRPVGPHAAYLAGSIETV